MEDNKEQSLVVPESNSSSLEIRVLVLEQDGTCPFILETTLKSCGYIVSKCQLATEALSLLEEDRSRYDVIFSDANLPDMDGFKLLAKVGLEMNLPVVLISPEKKLDSILNGHLYGAYVIKPITSDSLGHLGEHVLLKKNNDQLRVLLIGDGKLQETNLSNDHRIVQESLSGINEDGKSTMKRVKDEKDGVVNEASCDATKVKKARLIWTHELHKKFDLALEELGEEDSVPKKILEKMQSMGVPNLTRENVASHLQKKRLQDTRKTNQTVTKTLLGLRPRNRLKQLSYALDKDHLRFKSCTDSDRLSFPSPTVLEHSNSGVMAFPEQGSISPLDLDSSQVMGYSDCKMVQQFGDHDGRLDNSTPGVMDNIFQPNGQTPEYYLDTNQHHQLNEMAPSRLMIEGPGDFPFGYRCENGVNTASSETNDAAMLQHLTMSTQLGCPLQVQDSINHGPNSFIDNIAGVGSEEYVTMGNNAPFYNEPLVGDAFCQTLVQDDQLGFDGDDFMQKPFIEQHGSGLAETK